MKLFNEENDVLIEGAILVLFITLLLVNIPIIVFGATYVLKKSPSFELSLLIVIVRTDIG